MSLEGSLEAARNAPDAKSSVITNTLAVPAPDAGRLPYACRRISAHKLFVSKWQSYHAAFQGPDLTNADSSVHDEQDKVALQRRIAMLEARLRDSSSTRQSNDAGTNPEGLLVMLENISLGQPASTTTFDRIVTPLYQIGRPVFLMLIPDRDSSHRIVDFALENLTWLHCAVRTHVFQQEHFRFWESIEAGSESSFESDHGWLSVYFSLLAVSSSGYSYIVDLVVSCLHDSGWISLHGPRMSSHVTPVQWACIHT